MSYIERKKALEFVLNNTPHINGETTMKCVERAIKAIPTADVVEVVRCKDCKYYNENKFTYSGDGYGRCDHPQQAYDDECFDMWVETIPDDYCSYGERREE